MANSLGLLIVEALFAEKKLLGVKLSKDRMVQVVESVIQANKKKPTPRRPDRPPDDIWIRTLQALPAYKNVNVEHEFNKAKSWCLVRAEPLSRKRFINWLNKADSNIPLNSQPIRKSVTSEPAGWREYVNEAYPDSVYAKGGGLEHYTWSQLDAPIQQKFLNELRGRQR